MTYGWPATRILDGYTPIFSPEPHKNRCAGLLDGFTGRFSRRKKL